MMVAPRAPGPAYATSTFATEVRRQRDVRFPPESDRITDITACLKPDARPGN